MKYEVGIVSGHFNPIHLGHIELFEAARGLCDSLIVIVNNDAQAIAKCGTAVFDQETRRKIVESIKYVDFAVIAIDKDESVAESLDQIGKINNGKSSLCFINAGDRDESNSNHKEVSVCGKHLIKIEYLKMPKVDSSTRLRSCCKM